MISFISIKKSMTNILAPGNLLADKTINKYNVGAPAQITSNHFFYNIQLTTTHYTCMMS